MCVAIPMLVAHAAAVPSPQALRSWTNRRSRPPIPTPSLRLVGTDAAAFALDNAHIRERLEREAQTDSITGLYNHRYFHERLRQLHELMRAAEATTRAVGRRDDRHRRLQEGERHLRPRRRRRSCWRASPSTCAQPCGRRTSSAGSAARSSRSSSRRDDGRGREARSPSGSRNGSAAVELDVAGRIAVSIGIAQGPEHAANPRELVACAEAAMMTAKARGKNQHRPLRRDGDRAPAGETRRDDLRSIAHLKMLQSLGGKLNRLNDVNEIGTTIANELRLLIDYHNCRVFLRDGDELVPIALPGTADGVPACSPHEAFTTRVGEGITGHVVATGESLILGDASKCEFAVAIAGTEEIEESMIAVPLKYGTRVIGAIVDLEARARPVRRGRRAPARGAGRTRARWRSRTRGSTRPSGARRRARRHCSSSAAASPARRASTGCSSSSSRARRGSSTLPMPRSGCRTSPAATSSAAPGSGFDATTSSSGAASRTPWSRRSRRDNEPFFVTAERVQRRLRSRRQAAPARTRLAPFVVDGRWGTIAVASAGRAFISANESWSCSAGWPIRRSSRSRTRRASRGSRRRSSPRSRRSRTPSRRATSTTSSHARWITDTALRVGGELGLDGETLKRLELGALFHDIGKIGIPNSILLKPGPLTEEERLLIETHPELGERILAPIDQLARRLRESCARVTSAGTATGYPDRKAGDEIPLEARIIFACDAFHAMTTDRPYRRAPRPPTRRCAGCARRRHAVRPGRGRGLPARSSRR